MILKNDQGQIIAREEDVVTREHIVNRKTQIDDEVTKCQQRLTDLLALQTTVNEDLAEYDKITGAGSASDQSVGDNTNTAQDNQEQPTNPPAPTT